MRAVRKDKHCSKCHRILDRKGLLCQRCHMKSIVRLRQKYPRETRKVTVQLKTMKKQIYDQILKEVNEQLDKEESEK